MFLSKVDNNEDYDDMAVVGADIEERYFDGEDPDTLFSDTDTWLPSYTGNSIL